MTENAKTIMHRPTRPRHDLRADHERVVVTGMGMVSPLGSTVDECWANAVAGVSGIRTIRHFDPSEHRVQIAGTVDGFDAAKYLTGKDVRRYDEFVHYGVAAATMALQQAQLIDESVDAANSHHPLLNVDPYRAGVIIGSGIGGLQTLENNRDALREFGARRVSPFFLPASIINITAGLVAIKHGLKGANLATATACTTSAHAIGLAARLIAYGDCDVMLAGGSEKGSSPLGMAGFAAMQALSTRNDTPSKASRPFDRDRDGFVLGDGAGVLVLESLMHARARGAVILAELVGFGMSDDAHHITAPPPDGAGAARAMATALIDAGLSPLDIGYINAHGTSTPAGDVAESIAIERTFGNHAHSLAISSTKSMTGHLLGAAGAVESIFTVQSLLTQLIAPTINLDNPDPACRLDYTAHSARSLNDLDYAMSNSFGFGGTNASLIFAKYSA